jgi:hypothetical protein
MISLPFIFPLGFASSLSSQKKPDSNAPAWNSNFDDGWRQFDQLIKEQKYEAASS